MDHNLENDPLIDIDSGGIAQAACIESSGICGTSTLLTY